MDQRRIHQPEVALMTQIPARAIVAAITRLDPASELSLTTFCRSMYATAPPPAAIRNASHQSHAVRLCG